MTACQNEGEIAWRITEADAGWTGTTVTMELAPGAGGTRLNLAHTGRAEANTHFRTSSYCWAVYLRILRTVLEGGPAIPYGLRQDA